MNKKFWIVLEHSLQPQCACSSLFNGSWRFKALFMSWKAIIGCLEPRSWLSVYDMKEFRVCNPKICHCDIRIILS